MPTLAAAHNNWGLALKGALRLPEAVPQFERAAALEPGNPEFPFNLAVTLHEDPVRLNTLISVYLLALAVFLPVSASGADMSASP